MPVPLVFFLRHAIPVILIDNCVSPEIALPGSADHGYQHPGKLGEQLQPRAIVPVLVRPLLSLLANPIQIWLQCWRLK